MEYLQVLTIQTEYLHDLTLQTEYLHVFLPANGIPACFDPADGIPAGFYQWTEYLQVFTSGRNTWLFLPRTLNTCMF